MFYFFRTLVNEIRIVNVRFTNSARTFIYCPEIFIFFKNSYKFALLLSLGINSHILGASEDMLPAPKYTARPLRPCSPGSSLKLYDFCIKWKNVFHNFGS